MLLSGRNIVLWNTCNAASCAWYRQGGGGAYLKILP